jgi:hypothetical protein
MRKATTCVLIVMASATATPAFAQPSADAAWVPLPRATCSDANRPMYLLTSSMGGRSSVHLLRFDPPTGTIADERDLGLFHAGVYSVLDSMALSRDGAFLFVAHETRASAGAPRGDTQLFRYTTQSAAGPGRWERRDLPDPGLIALTVVNDGRGPERVFGGCWRRSPTHADVVEVDSAGRKLLPRASIAGTDRIRLTSTDDGRLFGYEFIQDTLLEFDPVTGAVVSSMLVGLKQDMALAFWGGAFWFFRRRMVQAPAMAFVTDVYKLDPTKGLPTLVANDLPFDVAAAAVPPCRHRSAAKP